MSIYDNDPRVQNFQGRGTLFHVAHQAGEDSFARVRRFLDGPTWAVWFCDEDVKSEWQEFSTADDAIRSLIGDPQ